MPEKMTRSTELAKRLREVFLDGRWIANTNYSDQLRSLPLELALQKPGGSNSIAALVFHVNYYLEGLIEAFDKGVLSISDKYSYDLPYLEAEREWEEMVNVFLRNAGVFASRVEALPDERLDQPFIDARYGTYLRNIEGVIEHSYYHLGQVVLIRKWIATLQS
jgi:uncharacterized damage-inducible protein DinB